MSGDELFDEEDGDDEEAEAIPLEFHRTRGERVVDEKAPGDQRSRAEPALLLEVEELLVDDLLAVSTDHAEAVIETVRRRIQAAREAVDEV